MRLRILLERLSLYLLLAFLVISAFAFLTFLAKETMHWAIFPNLADEFFTLSLGLLFGALFVLSVTNMALNLGIATTSKLIEKKLLPSGKELLRSNLKIVGALAGFALLTLLVLFLVNKSNISGKISEVEEEMEAFVKTNQTTLNELVELFKNKQDAKKAMRLLELMGSTTPYFRDLRIVYPILQDGRTVYKQVDWYRRYDNAMVNFFEYEESRLLRPNRFELEYLEEATINRTATFKPGVFVMRPSIWIYQPLKDSENNTILFLHSGNHQFGHREYK